MLLKWHHLEIPTLRILSVVGCNDDNTVAHCPLPMPLMNNIQIVDIERSFAWGLIQIWMSSINFVIFFQLNMKEKSSR
jgi:hypothetical protein